MEKIEVIRLPQNEGYKARVDDGVYNSKIFIEACSDNPLGALSNLLYDLKLVCRRYDSIPDEHISYDGRKIKELASQTIETMQLQRHIENLVVTA